MMGGGRAKQVKVGGHKSSCIMYVIMEEKASEMVSPVTTMNI